MCNAHHAHLGQHRVNYKFMKEHCILPSFLPLLLNKKRFEKIACIRSHHLHLQWKFKLWAGKFAWGVKAKHCWALSTNFLFSKVCCQHPAMFCLYTSSKLYRHNLNFQWRWRWWDRMQAIFLNNFYFIDDYDEYAFSVWYRFCRIWSSADTEHVDFLYEPFLNAVW